ncbi:pentatricopeptide repeat-containing protein At4g38150 [Rosa chinensis]|uniref:pentatricopeptide repeat-containing protein At4g38150 n=1 Tax=Rosa chinensis TaxID=74649 RepID=UPI000D08F7E4|nr:pentatricopeptide repeat-containing protein At4g38150 [Rosa chinensis]
MFKADGNYDQAMELYRRSWETNTIPAVVLHTGVIGDCLEAGNTECALKAYRTMLVTGVAPNSYTYTVLIKGLTTDPNFCGDAKRCLLEMMERGMRSNAATYTTVIEGFAKQEDKVAEEEGKQLVEVMMGNGFVPNAKAMMEVLKGD